MTSLPLERGRSNAAMRRRGRGIAAVGLGLMFVIALVREFVAPHARLPFSAQFLGPPGHGGSLWNVLVLLVSIVTELVALSGASRVLERRGARPPTVALVTALLGPAVMVLFGLTRWLAEGGDAPKVALGDVRLGPVVLLFVLLLARRALVAPELERHFSAERARGARRRECFNVLAHAEPVGYSYSPATGPCASRARSFFRASASRAAFN